MSAAGEKLTRGQTVFYNVRSNVFRARVETIHRDGDVTVQAQFIVDQTGKDTGTYFGVKVRLPRRDLRLAAGVQP